MVRRRLQGGNRTGFRDDQRRVLKTWFPKRANVEAAGPLHFGGGKIQEERILVSLSSEGQGSSYRRENRDERN